MAKLKTPLALLLVGAFVLGGLTLTLSQLWSGFTEGYVVTYGRASSTVSALSDNPAAFYAGMALNAALTAFLLWLPLSLLAHLSRNRRTSMAQPGEPKGPASAGRP